MNKNIMIGVIAIVVIIGGALAFSASNSSMKENDAMMKEDGAMMKKDDVMVKDGDAMMQKEDAMMQKDDAMMKEDGAMMSNKGSYEAYGPEKLAFAEKGKVVLFFRASWCPTCRSLDADIKANTVPEGVTILDVNYDDSSDLKKKYGVTTQHTLVQVDASGNLIAKWTGSPDLAGIVSKIK